MESSEWLAVDGADQDLNFLSSPSPDGFPPCTEEEPADQDWFKKLISCITRVQWLLLQLAEIFLIHEVET